VKKFKASETSSERSTGKAAFSEFWEAPERFWRKDIGDAEITAILASPVLTLSCYLVYPISAEWWSVVTLTFLTPFM
jgi:hypothetical protein